MREARGGERNVFSCLWGLWKSGVDELGVSIGERTNIYPP